MILKLGVCNDSSNRIDKTVEFTETVTGNMKGALNVDALQMFIQYDIMQFNFNYCYVEELHRYYFIGTPVVLPNGMITLPLECDVLMSFKPVIDEITGTLKNSAKPEPYNNSFSKPFDVRPTVKRVQFNDAFNADGNIIMITIRGTI